MTLKSFQIFSPILIFFLCHAAASQTIIQIRQGFALVDTDALIVPPHGTFEIYRNDADGTQQVGSARLIKSRNGRSIVQLINKPGGLNIKKGDFLKQNQDEILIESDLNAYSAYFDQTRLSLVQRVANFVRIRCRCSDVNPGEILVVYRENEAGIFKLGQVRVIDWQKGDAAAEIIQTDVPLEIEPGDFIMIRRAVNHPQVPKAFMKSNKKRPKGYLGRITRLAEGYCLVEDITRPVTANQVTVKRLTDFGPEQIGIVTILVRRKHLLAVKAHTLLPGQTIKEGDFIVPLEVLEKPITLPLDEFLNY